MSTNEERVEIQTSTVAIGINAEAVPSNEDRLVNTTYQLKLRKLVVSSNASIIGYRKNSIIINLILVPMIMTYVFR